MKWYIFVFCQMKKLKCKRFAVFVFLFPTTAAFVWTCVCESFAELFLFPPKLQKCCTICFYDVGNNKIGTRSQILLGNKTKLQMCFVLYWNSHCEMTPVSLCTLCGALGPCVSLTVFRYLVRIDLIGIFVFVLG